MMRRLFKGTIILLGYAYRGCLSLTKAIAREAFKATHSEAEVKSITQSAPESEDLNNLAFLQHTGSVFGGEQPRDKVQEERQDEMVDPEIKRAAEMERVIKDLVEGENLNWEAADRYLRLVSAALGPDSKYRIMNSSFLRALNSRENNRLKKFLGDGGVKSTHVIIIPILTSNRWYFIKIENKLVTLYDCNEEISETYRRAPPVKEILKMVREDEINVSSEFPQTKVSRDSGIFMLLGIRDVVEEKTWRFTEEEVKQKRSQIIQELLEGQLIKGDK